MSRAGTMSVVMAKPALAALQRHVIDPQPVLRAANVSQAALAVVENRLPAENVRAHLDHGQHVAHLVPQLRRNQRTPFTFLGHG